MLGLQFEEENRYRKENKMVQSNDYRGASLRDAMKKATAVYERKRRNNRDDQRACNDLILEITQLQRQLSRASDRIERLEDQIDDLRRSAVVKLGLAALAALGNLAGALRGARVIILRIKNKNAKKLSRSEVLDLLSALGAVGAAGSALLAASDLLKAERLARRAEVIEREAANVGRELLEVLTQYENAGCGASRQLLS